MTASTTPADPELEGRLIHDAEQPCPYLPGQVARMPLYLQERALTPAETDVRLARSERRVGRCLYRTQCAACNACQGIRVPVDAFVPSRSQRRVLARWGDDARVDFGPPLTTDDRLAMFNRHKAERGLAHDREPMDAIGYASWLVQSCSHTVEMRYYFRDEVVGFGVLDIGQDSASSVYFYFSPDFGRLSPGVFSVLQEIAFCRRTGRRWLYLGLYVQDCRHLAYKAEYRPHERLVDGAWVAAGA